MVYNVKISEILCKQIDVDAKSASEALEIARKKWKNSEVVLCGDDFDHAEFEIV